MAATRSIKIIQQAFITTVWLLLTGLMLTAQAQPSFTTKASSSSIGKGELLEVSYEVKNGDFDQFTAPTFTGWSIVGGPNIKTSSLTINGQKTTTAAYQFILRPTGTGSLTLPGATAVIDGQNFTSSSLTIEVGTQSSGGSIQVPGQTNTAPGWYEPQEDSYDGYVLYEGEKAEEKIAKNLFLRVELNKKTSFEGEPIVADYLLYSRVSLNAKVTRSPSFSGFSSIDLKDASGNDFEVARLGGKTYKVYRVRKVQLYPLQSGTLRLEPVELDATVQFRRVPKLANMHQYDPYSPDNYVTLPYTVKSDAIDIAVQPLPAANRPATMQNAVGRFAIKAKWLQNQVQRGQAATLELQISGQGNWALVTPPSIKWPAGIEVFEPALLENIDSQAVPVQGSRTYLFKIVSQQPGWLSFPAISFSYFDPWQKNYATIKTDSLALEVLPTLYSGSEAPTASSNTTDDLTEVFTDLITIVFPLLAIVLLVYLMWRNRQKHRQLALAAPDGMPGQPAIQTVITQPAVYVHGQVLHKKEDETINQRLLENEELTAPRAAAIATSVQPATTTPDPYLEVTQAYQQLNKLLDQKWQLPNAATHPQLTQELIQAGINSQGANQIAEALRLAGSWLYSPLRQLEEAQQILKQLQEAKGLLQ